MIGGPEPIESISLATLFQVLAMDKSTCAVEIESPDGGGTVYLASGELVDARSGGSRGVEAARRLVSLPSASFRLVAGAAAPERTIHEPLMKILLRLAQEDDEDRAPAAGAASGPRRRRRGASFTDLLDELAERLPELVASDVVHVDSGLSIGGVSRRAGFDASLAAASAAEIVKANRRASRLLGLDADATEDILITSRDVLLLIRRIDARYCQVVALTGRGNLGLARAWMQTFHSRLREALAWLA